MRKKIVSFVWFVSFWSKSGFGVRVTNNKCHPSVCLGRHAMLHYLALRDDSNNGLEDTKGWKLWTTFQVVSFISNIFRSVEPKFSYHFITEILGIFG